MAGWRVLVGFLVGLGLPGPAREGFGGLAGVPMVVRSRFIPTLLLLMDGPLAARQTGALAQLCAFPSCCQGGTGNHRSMSGALPTRRSQVRVLVPPTSECRLGLGNNLVVSGAARAP